MFNKILATLAGAVFVFLGLAACDQIADAEEQERWEAAQFAEAVSRGNEAVAACIATRCNVLDIDGMRLEDYSVINGLTHVTVLMASRTSFDNLDDISGMQQLKELHITSAKITDLTGLKYFPRLKVLHIQNMPPNMDISPIAQLNGLTELAIGGLDADDDASFIQNMRQLEKLAISWSDVVADISILRGHPSLRNVDILGGLPVDQSVLLTLPKLESMMLDRGMYPVGESLNQDVQDELERRGAFSYNETFVVC